MSTIELCVPDVGTESAVEVIEILVAKGDEIAVDDPIVVLETDKASIEVPATSAGTVEEIKVKLGDQVKLDEPLLSINASEVSAAGDKTAESESSHNSEPEPAEPTKSESAASGEKADQAISDKGEVERLEVHVPDLGGAAEVEVIELSIAKGDSIQVDDALVVLESDKASMDIPSPYTGRVLELKVAIGDKLSEGDLLAVIEAQQVGTSDSKSEALSPIGTSSDKTEDTKAEEEPKPSRSDSPSPSALTPQTNSSTNSTVSIHAGPAVRKLARELGVELERVVATGPKGRVQKDDLSAYIKQQVQAAQSGQFSQAGSGFAAPKLPDFSKFGEIETRKLEKVQLVTARNMQSSWANIPHVTQFDEADITELEAFRKSKKKDAERRDLKLTILPFLLKACAFALRDLPQFNVSLDLENQTAIYKKYIHIGIAVDTPHGLVVPVIKDVIKKDMWQLSSEIIELASKAKARKLSPQEMQGACFTISSLGGLGGTAFTPIVNQPEVAILGVSKAGMKPVYINDDFAPRLMLPLSLSYDHRAVNGADAARFTTVIAKYLSDIRELLF